MFRFYARWCVAPLWASPGTTMIDEILRTGGWRGQRRSNNLVPAYSIYNGIEEPLAPPAKPIPTDVPVKEPIDVPVRGPHDVPPPPRPERQVPPPTREPHDRPSGPQSRM